MLLESFQVFSNISNEVAAAYATGAIGIVLAFFQFIGRGKDRKKNQINAIDLEKFKQKSELFMSLKRNQIDYNDELLNEVYRVRVEIEKTLLTPDLTHYQFLIACLNDFEAYYRRNANKINYLDKTVRSHTHDILKYSNMISSMIKLWEQRGLDTSHFQSIEINTQKLQAEITEYEKFLREMSIKEFKSLNND